MKRKQLTDQQMRRIAWETSVATGSMVPYGAIVNSLLRANGCKK